MPKQCIDSTTKENSSQIRHEYRLNDRVLIRHGVENPYLRTLARPTEGPYKIIDIEQRIQSNASRVDTGCDLASDTILNSPRSKRLKTSFSTDVVSPRPTMNRPTSATVCPLTCRKPKATVVRSSYQQQTHVSRKTGPLTWKAGPYRSPR